MTARLPSDLLARSAEESCRLLALGYLDEIGRAESRLADPQDAEALHDFRVGLRRLRSCTRAYRAHLKGSVTGKMQQRLRKLSLATSAGRDTEVHLDWLRNQGERLESEETQGLSWLIGRLEGRQYESTDRATAEVGRRFVKAATKFRPRLATLRVEIGAGQREKRSFGQFTGELIQQQVARLGEDLARVREAANVKEAHKARISIKRLRYLLEPVARRTSRARGLISRLKEAQDILGSLHDMHVLSDEIASSIAALAGGPLDRALGPLPGLRALERLANEQAVAAFERFEVLWGGERAGRFLLRAGGLGRSLTEGPAKVTHEAARLRLTGRRAEAPPIIGEMEPRDAPESMSVSQEKW